jgi:hypothetical protein
MRHRGGVRAPRANSSDAHGVRPPGRVPVAALQPSTGTVSLSLCPGDSPSHDSANHLLLNPS